MINLNVKVNHADLKGKLIKKIRFFFTSFKINAIILKIKILIITLSKYSRTPPVV